MTSGMDALIKSWTVFQQNRPQAAGRSITTNNQPRQSGADIVAIALSFFKLSQSASGDAETKKRERGGLRRSRWIFRWPFHSHL